MSRYVKKTFISEKQARDAAKRMGRKHKHIPVPYFCNVHHGYHLTSARDF
jgi:hypothetical protein